jgi:uncharacterized membrane protein YphA (DoxX/SURF4 family)
LAYYKVVVSRRQIGKSSGETGAFSLADYRRQLGAGAVIALVILRLAIGWHFFREGLGKLAYDEGTRQYHVAFSAESFLAQAKGPWAAKFRAWAPNVHDWLALLEVPRQKHELTAEEAAQQSKSQAEYNERLAQASKNGGTSSVEFPPVAPYRDWAARIVEDWKLILSNVTAIPALTEEQRHRAAEIFAQRTQQLSDYLATQTDAITDNQHELWRLDGWRAMPEAADVPYQQKRIATKAAETTAAATPWVNQVRDFEQKFIDDLREILTPEQRAQAITKQSLDTALTSPKQARLNRLNVGVTILTIGVGACLLLGCFTRLASLAGALFLLAVVATQPPWIADAAPAYNQIVELAGLLVLAATGAGRWLGLDYLTYRLFSRSRASED